VRLSHLPRLVRTLRHLRPGQALCQLRHVLRPGVAQKSAAGPLEWGGETATVYFAPAPRHAFGDGHRVELLSREVVFGKSVDWDHETEGPLWAFHLHQFDWLRSAAASPGRRVELMLDWILRHRRGVGWSPHPTSLRILSWGKLLLEEGALEASPGQRERIVASLADQAETLAANLETRLQANHLLSNLLGVVFAGMLLRGPAADRWLGLSARFRRELALQIGADGSHQERSPMYHALLLENLLDLLSLCRAAHERAPAGLEEDLAERAAAMRGALEVWMHPDGEIALFGDSAFGIAQPPAQLFAYADALGVSARKPATPGWLSDAGFVRLEAGDFSLLASLSGPQPAHQPGHAHSDALAFELCIGAQRIVTDTGVAEYLPGPLRDLSRATRAHATLEVAGHDQCETWAAHRIGGRPRVDVEGIGVPAAAVATCAGWSTPGSVHRRRFDVSEGAVEIHDELLGQASSVLISLPLAPGLQPELRSTDSGPEARIPLPGGRALRIALPASARWRVETEKYFPEFGSVVSRAVLRGQDDAFERGCTRFEVESDA